MSNKCIPTPKDSSLRNDLITRGVIFGESLSNRMMITVSFPDGWGLLAKFTSEENNTGYVINNEGLVIAKYIWSYKGLYRGLASLQRCRRRKLDLSKYTLNNGWFIKNYDPSDKFIELIEIYNSLVITTQTLTQKLDTFYEHLSVFRNNYSLFDERYPTIRKFSDSYQQNLDVIYQVNPTIRFID